MTMNGWRRVGRAGLAVATGLLFACSGGGGGSGGSSATGFALTDVEYGRQIDYGTGPTVVSPLTTVQLDPVTGFAVPGTLAGLSGAVAVSAPQTVGLGSDYLPRVVPRNATIVLHFSDAIDPASVTADQINGNGALTQAGTVQIRLADNTPIPVTVTLHDATTIWVTPFSSTSVGFPPSPVDFGPGGEPRADATGFLRLRIPRAGNGTLLRSASGKFLSARADRLGDPSNPIGLNPGNRVLDFIAQNELIPTNETFNGFLPDHEAPRIVRTHSLTGTFDSTSGDAATSTSLTIGTKTFSTLAKHGSGEWAGGRLVLRAGTVSEETHAIVSNTAQAVTLATPIATLPVDGDDWSLERSEYFEPDLAHPIDPATFDPDNPENSNNSTLASFAEVWEIDATGAVVAGPTTLRQTVPTYSEIRLRFSEPMSAESFLQWETFRVAYNPDGGDNAEILSDISLDATQRVVSIRPVRLDQGAGTFEVVGWGRNVKALQLILATVPGASFLQQQLAADLNSNGVADFLDVDDAGLRGIVDLGGQSLGFPAALFDYDPNRPESAAIRYTAAFSSSEAALTQANPATVRSWGVAVHRMRGTPKTGLDPDSGQPGVKYRDQPNYYSPIADVNLQTNGVLAGSPVVYLTKIHDEFFPPPHGQFSKLFNGLPAPLASNVTAANSAHDGARFQCVWRDADASPNYLALKGTLLDLYRVSWAPIGGNVTSDTYDNISVRCAHSPVRPNSANNTASALYPISGINAAFDYNTYIDLLKGNNPCSGAASNNLNCGNSDAPNWWDALVTVVPSGTRYKVTQSNLFTPTGDGNAWHPWPTFTVPFQYNNGDIPQAELDLRQSINSTYNCQGGQAWSEYRTFDSNPDYDNLGGDSLLFEVRVRPQTTTISGANGFSYVIGCLIDFAGQPYWRSYSQGSPTTQIQPDSPNDNNAKCAVGSLTSTATPIPFGDNSRYLGVFDYVKTTSRITSPYVRVYPSNTASPDYYPVILSPPVSSQPLGTSASFLFSGASGVKGSGATTFSANINTADTKPNLAFRVTLVGNTSTLLLPSFDTIAVPYLRPTGN